MRAGPRRFLSWFNHLQLSAPLVEAPRSYPEFSCQLTDIFASLHAFDSPLLKFPGVSLSLHCGSFPGNCALFLCVSSRVHSIRGVEALVPEAQLHRERLPSKRGFRFQQLHPIFLTINVSNKSGHLLFAPQSMEKIRFLHSYRTALAGAGTSAWAQAILNMRRRGALIGALQFPKPSVSLVPSSERKRGGSAKTLPGEDDLRESWPRI